MNGISYILLERREKEFKYLTGRRMIDTESPANATTGQNVING